MFFTLLLGLAYHEHVDKSKTLILNRGNSSLFITPPQNYVIDHVTSLDYLRKYRYLRWLVILVILTVCAGSYDIEVSSIY